MEAAVGTTKTLPICSGHAVAVAHVERWIYRDRPAQGLEAVCVLHGEQAQCVNLISGKQPSMDCTKKLKLSMRMRRTIKQWVSTSPPKS